MTDERKSFFSENVRYFRDRHGLSRNELAAALEKPAAVIGDWEIGKISPDVHALITLSDFFKVSVDQLIKFNFKGNLTAVKDKKIKLLILDIDGVLTDGGMYYTESGDEFKKFNTKDGMAIKNIIRNGITVGIISSGYNYKLIKRRAELLGIEHVYAGDEPKKNIVELWCKEHHYQLPEIAYIGDDINDMEVMQMVGVAACPSDAVERVKNCCHIILGRKGGEGCVREFVDNYLFA